MNTSFYFLFEPLVIIVSLSVFSWRFKWWGRRETRKDNVLGENLLLVNAFFCSQYTFSPEYKLFTSLSIGRTATEELFIFIWIAFRRTVYWYWSNYSENHTSTLPTAPLFSPGHHPSKTIFWVKRKKHMKHTLWRPTTNNHKITSKSQTQRRIIQLTSFEFPAPYLLLLTLFCHTSILSHIKLWGRNFWLYFIKEVTLILQ